MKQIIYTVVSLVCISIIFNNNSYVNNIMDNSSNKKNNSIQGIILAAGMGTRFRTNDSKLITPLCGQEMVLFPTKLLNKLEIPITMVVGFQRDLVIKTVQKALSGNDINFVVQEEQLGTGHALLCTKNHWNADNILIMNGDMPLITEGIIQELVKKHFDAQAAISFIVSHNTDTSIGYGRFVEKDGIARIVEAKHFTATPEEYPLVNAGIFIVNRSFLEQYLDSIQQNEFTKEFYITDLIELASINKKTIVPVQVSFDTLHGVNTLQQLEKAERIKRKEIVNYWMDRGVRFENPKTVVIDLSASIGSGSIIGSGVELLGNTSIGKKCTIRSFSILENCTIEDEVTVHPYTRLTTK